jgi:hypothetical protein
MFCDLLRINIYFLFLLFPHSARCENKLTVRARQARGANGGICAGP